MQRESSLRILKVDPYLSKQKVRECPLLHGEEMVGITLNCHRILYEKSPISYSFIMKILLM